MNGTSLTPAQYQSLVLDPQAAQKNTNIANEFANYNATTGFSNSPSVAGQVTAYPPPVVNNTPPVVPPPSPGPGYYYDYGTLSWQPLLV